MVFDLAPNANQVFQYIGIIFILIVLCKFLYDILNLFRIHLLSKICQETNFTKKYGEWAVVTGCTQGIGLAYCRELAQRGMNIVMISLLLDELESTSKEIENKYQVQVRIIQADFSQGLPLYRRLAQELNQVKVGVLVNNVGVCVPYYMPFEEMTEKSIWDHVALNVTAATMMTAIVLPNMKTARKGAIINVSSSATYAPATYFNMYAATKSYLRQFSLALNMECEGSGVTVQTLIPNFVQTNLASKIILLPRIFVPTPEKFVHHAITTLGVADFTTGYWIHEIIYWIVTKYPQSLCMRVQKQLSLSERKKYFKEMQTA